MPTITLLNPQNTIYTLNASISLTFTIDEPASWIGYSLNGQPNETITQNTTLPALPDGWHTVVIYTNDTYGNMTASPTQLFTIDTTPPTGSITINDGAASTISASVTFTLTAEDATSGVAQMRFFDAAWGDWEHYATSKYWVFKEGDGYKFIYVQFRDNAGLVSSPYRASIILGTNAPSDPAEAYAKLPEKLKESLEPPKTIEKDEAEKPPEEEKPAAEETAPTTPQKSTPELNFTSAVAIIIVAILLTVPAIWRLFREH